MEKHISKVLSIEKISDIRLRISLAKEYVSTEESQDGLYRVVKTVLEGVAGLMSMALMCFTCLSNLAEAFAGKPKESEEKREKQEPSKTMSQKDFDDLDALIADLESQDKTIYPHSPTEEYVELSQDMLDILEMSEQKFDYGIKNETNQKKDSHKENFEVKVDERGLGIFVERDLTPILVHILDKLWEYRFEVNPLSVCIIEIIYEWTLQELNNNESPEFRRELGDKSLSDFKALWKIIRTKYNQKLPDFEADMEKNRDSFLIYINQIFEICQALSDTKYEETLALHLSQTPVFHLKDVLIFQEKKRQYQGDLRNLVKTLIVEYESLYAENQIREIIEWVENTEINQVTSSPAYLIPKIEDKRLIKINPEYIIPIASAFTNYFDEIDMKLFVKLLEGEKVKSKIIFMGSSSQLVHAFRILIDSKKNLIANKKKELESWLIDNFRFYSKDTKRTEDLKFDTVKAILSRSSFKEPRSPIEFPFDC